MNEETYFKELAKAMATKMAEQIDKEFLQGISLLSVRKKEKIKKWVVKALKRKDKEKDY